VQSAHPHEDGRRVAQAMTFDRSRYLVGRRGDAP
jgi:hypothetical protein